MQELRVVSILVLVVREEYEHLSGRTLLEAVADRVVGVVDFLHPDDEAFAHVVGSTLERDLILLRHQRVERFHVQLPAATLGVEDDHGGVRAVHCVAVNRRRNLLPVSREERRQHELRIHFSRSVLAVSRPIDVQRDFGISERSEQEALGVVVVPVGLEQCERLSLLYHEVFAHRHHSGSSINSQPVSLGETIGGDADAGGVATVPHLFFARDRSGATGSVSCNDHCDFSKRAVMLAGSNRTGLIYV